MVLAKQQAPSATGERDLLELANEEIIRKERVSRELKKRTDLYEGRGLEAISKTELQGMSR